VTLGVKKLIALGTCGLCGAALATAILSSGATGSSSGISSAPPIVVPALSHMTGLGRAATARDRAVTAAAEPALNALTDPQGAPPGMAPGAVEPARLRILLDNLGSSHRAIYAVPTRGGRVCGGLTGGPSGCLEGFTAAGPVDYSIGDADAIGSGEPAIVWGLAPDDVRSVHVVVGGTSYPAVMGKNAYFFEFPSAVLEPSAVSAIVVGFASGGSQSIELKLGTTQMP
jgi:hypothetical protein